MSETKLLIRVAVGMLVGMAAVVAILIITTTQGTRSDAASTNQQIAEGRRLYDEYCASCHGIDGEGQAS